MNTLQDIARRLAALERQVVRYRQGVVTDSSPLTVDLGDSGTSVTAASPRPRAASGTVDALAWGSDLLVLPGADEFLKLATAADNHCAFGQDDLTFSGGSVSGETTVTHGLKDSNGSNLTPVLVVATSNWATDCSVIVSAYTFAATTFKLKGYFAGGEGTGTTGTVPVSWIAIG